MSVEFDINIDRVAAFLVPYDGFILHAYVAFPDGLSRRGSSMSVATAIPQQRNSSWSRL